MNFIYRSLYNRKIDLYRKNIRRIIEECDENIALLPDRSSSEAETRILFKDVLKALSTLQRDVILLRYYKDYSDREIAEKLKISRQAVNKAKNRGLKRLKELITL